MEEVRQSKVLREMPHAGGPRPRRGRRRGLRRRCEESALALQTLAVTLVTSRVPRTWRSRQQGQQVRIRAIPVCRGTEGQNVLKQTWWKRKEGFPVPGNKTGNAQAEVSGPSVPVRGASLRMTSLCKERPIHCSSVLPLGLICKCKHQPGLIFQAENS